MTVGSDLSLLDAEMVGTVGVADPRLTVLYNKGICAAVKLVFALLCQAVTGDLNAVYLYYYSRAFLSAEKEDKKQCRGDKQNCRASIARTIMPAVRSEMGRPRKASGIAS